MNYNEFFADYFLKNKKINKKTFQNLTKNFEDEGFDCLNFLLENNMINEHDKIEAMSSCYDIPTIDLELINISNNFEKWFNIELMQKYQFVPIYVAKDDNVVLHSRDNTVKFIDLFGIHIVI